MASGKQQFKALVAQTVHVGDNVRAIDKDEIVDFDQPLGTVERPNPDGNPESAPITLKVRLGDVVNPDHFVAVTPAKETAPAAPPATVSKPKE